MQHEGVFAALAPATGFGHVATGPAHGCGPARGRMLMFRLENAQSLVGVALTLLLTGFFLMINRRKAITQVLALLTTENGLMLAAVALSTYGLPLVVAVIGGSPDQFVPLVSALYYLAVILVGIWLIRDYIRHP